MDRKFRTKYGSAPEAKLARLENIRRKINSATNNFNWANVNDPDYYDLNAASNYTNIDWYTNSLNGRISNYRRRVNATRSPAVGASRST
jgi:hypothetical protein